MLNKKFVQRKKHFILLFAGSLLLLLAMVTEADAAKRIFCPLLPLKAYKTNKSPAVYYITKDCRRRAFGDRETFFSYFTSWRQVIKVTEKKLFLIPLAPEGNMQSKFSQKISSNQSPIIQETAHPVDNTASSVPVVANKPVINPVVYNPPVINSPVVNSPPPATSTCGNSTIDSGEECDGGPLCNSQCKVQLQYARKDWVNPGDWGATQEFSLKVGDKLSISSQLTIRIENITSGSVEFSIWGKDNLRTCNLISNTGVLYMPGQAGRFPFREFTDGFIELISIQNDTATIKKYVGEEARVRCDQIGDWKKPIACSFYPDGKSYHIEDGSFQVFFHESSHQLAAEFFLHAFNNCLAVMKQQLPALQRITPYKPAWGVYAGAYKDAPMVASADYERISVWYDIMPHDKAVEYIPLIKGGQCPIGLPYIPHELSHLLFAATPLQGGYDMLRGAIEDNTPRPWPTDLTEGFAEFFAFWGTNNMNKEYYVRRASNCLTDRLVDTNDGSTPEQRMYKNILTGNGFGTNLYDAGLCFFDRVRKDCGDDTLRDVFSKSIKESGVTTSHATIFSLMSNTCSSGKVSTIMNDYGFDQSFSSERQKYPITGFSSKLTADACL